MGGKQGNTSSSSLFVLSRQHSHAVRELTVVLKHGHCEVINVKLQAVSVFRWPRDAVLLRLILQNEYVDGLVSETAALGARRGVLSLDFNHI